MIICMYNDIDKDIFPLASELKESGRNIPFVLLMHYSREIRRKITSRTDSAVDFVFSWHGNADLILAIIKLFEDRMNADNDIIEVGVQAILLVEDSIRYYSTYLPELYKLILTQSNEFLKETLNEDQQKKRKRSRPKILLATCYDEARSIYEKYRGHFVGIISDIGMVVHRGDPPSTEKLDAGIDLVNYIEVERAKQKIETSKSCFIFESYKKESNIKLNFINILPKKALSNLIHKNKDNVLNLIYAKDDSLITGNVEGDINIYSMKDSKLMKSLNEKKVQLQVNCFDMTPDGNFLLVG